MKYFLIMKFHTWNPEKNKILKKERNIFFEDVVYYIADPEKRKF